MTQEKSYNIYEISDKRIWDDFVTSQENHTFLHSWSWGEFNKEMGDKIWRLGFYERDALRAVALIIKVHARRGNFLFIPHGPIFAFSENWTNPKSEIRNPKQIPNPKFKILKIFTKKLKKIARQEKVAYIRISPLLEDSDENKELFKKFGFRAAPIHMHAETTWSLDLKSTEDELLMNMRKTTRNLIRRAMKEGAEIKTGDSERDVEIFNNLYQETVSKHNFIPFSLTYLKNQVKIFSISDEIKVFTAFYKNEPIASAIIVFYGNSAFYHHGASSGKYPKIPAAYLLQWGAIREARRRGHKLYNFWGIIDSRNTKHITHNNHPWAGITLFKKGFGGFQSDYLHAQDLPISWKYWPNYILETMRRIRRGL